MQASSAVSRSCLQPRQHGLRLGVAEARVELEHLGPARGHHQAGVQDAAEGSAALLEAVDDRLVHVAHDLGGARRVDARHRGVAAHAAGVRPGVAFADALEVLRRRHRDRRARRRTARAATAPRPRGTPRPARARPASPKRRSTKKSRSASLASAGDWAMITPLPAARPSAFSTAGYEAQSICASACSYEVNSTQDGGRARRPRASAPSRTPCCPRCARPRRAGRTRAGPRASSASTTPATSGASGPTIVRSTCSSRRQAHDAVDVLGRDVEAARVGGDAGVARRAQHLGRARAAQQRAHDRVLAAAAADDQDLSVRHCDPLPRDVAGDARAEHDER